MPASPERTYAIVVGVESYQMTQCSPLDGPAPDACHFVDWLRAQNVPAENIKLFLSPIESNRAKRPQDAAFADPLPAHDQIIRDAFSKWARTRDGDLLIVFWGGHGVSKTEDQRFLFYSDATDDQMRCLNLSSMLKKMSAPDFGIREQMLFIDACGTFGEQAGVHFEVTDYGNVPLPDPTRQHVLFAAGPGEVAKNITVEKTGMFSSAVFEALKTETEFPPDPQRLGALVGKHIETLREKGLTRQVPGLYEYVVKGRKVGTVIDGYSPSDQDDGTLVPKMYDRVSQDSAFWRKFKEGMESNTAPSLQIFVVFGEESEAHRSLVERLVGDRIMCVVDAPWTASEDSLGQVEIMEWSYPGEAFEVRQQSIRDAMHSYSGSDALKQDTALSILRGVPGFADRKLFVVSQEVVVESWTPIERQLLQWYLRDFWGTSALTAKEPNCVLFVQVVCAEQMFAEGSVASAFKDIQNDCAPGVTIDALLLAELTPLSERHLQSWLTRFIVKRAGPTFNVADQARALYQKASTRRNGIPRTDSIETELAKIHLQHCKR